MTRKLFKTETTMSREVQPNVCPSCTSKTLKRTNVANDESTGCVEHQVRCETCRHVWGEFFEYGVFQGLISYEARKPLVSTSFNAKTKISACPVCDRFCDSSGCRCERTVLVGPTLWRLIIMVHQECIKKQRGREIWEKVENLEPFLKIAENRFAENI
jgi:hypothetical protein